MNSIPFLLIYSRIVIAITVGLIAISEIDNYAIWIVSLISFGLLTDVFDGIIARKLNISTDKLRIWDSNVDQFFWLIVIASVFYLNFSFVKENFLWIAIILLLEFSSYLISYLKFKRTIATHSILAKVWTLSLLWFLIDLTLHSTSEVAFYSCIFLGVISRIEINLIVLRLKKWATDIPSILAVSKINRGQAIKKNKLFNS